MPKERHRTSRASHLADEIVRRFVTQEALGRPSIYNIAREVLIEEFVAEHNDGGE